MLVEPGAGAGDELAVAAPPVFAGLLLLEGAEEGAQGREDIAALANASPGAPGVALAGLARVGGPKFLELGAAKDGVFLGVVIGSGSGSGVAVRCWWWW